MIYYLGYQNITFKLCRQCSLNKLRQVLLLLLLLLLFTIIKYLFKRFIILHNLCNLSIVDLVKCKLLENNEYLI